MFLIPVQRHITCPVCDHHQFHPLEEYEKNHLHTCDSCSFVFADVIPDPEEMEAFYNSEYDLTSYFSPITKKRYHDILNTLEKYRRTNKLLDVGCGYGFFLEVAKEKGWEVQGIEYNQKCIDACRRKEIDVLQGDLRDLALEENSFDVVVCIELIEHLSFPKMFLQEVRKLLRSGGAVYLSTPNFNSLARLRLKAVSNVIDYPNHLGYFTVRTLRRLFRDQQFETQSITTTGYSITRIKTSRGESNQEFVSETSDDELLRDRIERRWYLRVLKSIITGFLNLFKIGDSLKGTFIKR